VDLRAVVEPRTDADPELQSERRSTNRSAAAVREAVVARGSRGAEWPSARTRREILNRRNSRLKRIRNGTPLETTAVTDAICAPVRQVRDQRRDDGETLEISRDTTAKVNLGAYARGGKNPDRRRR
jgi:hypothetical protein